MSSTISVNPTKIGNKTNFCKYVFLIMEPCSEAFFYVYKWLYSWDRSNPEDLQDHLNKIPTYDTTGKKLKNHLKDVAKFNKVDFEKIKDMKGQIDVLKGYDITLLYKVSFVLLFNYL